MPALYIHMPFCQSKCPFCSFAVVIGKEKDVDRYLDCLEKEAGAYKGERLETIYIGGGTPSYLSVKQLERLFAIIKDHFVFKKGSELTLEANPEDVDTEKSRALFEMGVNRISLGVQSLNDKYLKFLGRIHDSQRALRALDDLKKGGFSNISLDLMFAFPGQTMPELEKDVSRIADLKSDHLSLYTLTIEEGTKFSKQKVQLEEEVLQARQYMRVSEILESKGFRQYEISNFALPGKESKHNSMYWQGGDYIGLGIGAHSHKQGRRFWNTRNITAYMASLNNGRSPLEGEEQLSSCEQLIETVLFGLRMTEGVCIGQLEKKYDCTIGSERISRIHQLVDDGFLLYEKKRLKATPQGRLILDEICARLI